MSKIKENDNSIDFEQKETINEVVKDEIEKIAEEEQTLENDENIINKNYTKNNSKNSKKLIIIICIIIAAIIFCLLSIFIFIKVKVKDGRVVKNVYFNGIDLSGKTREEVITLVEDKYKDDYEKVRKIVITENDENKAREIIKKQIEKKLLSAESETEKGEKINTEEKIFNIFKELTISPKMIDFKIKSNKIAEEALSYGREKSLEKIKPVLKGERIEIKSKAIEEYNKEALKTFVVETDSKIPGRTIDNAFNVNEDKLIITKGIEGFDLNEEDFEKNILDNFKNVNNKKEEKDNKIIIKLNSKKPEKIDIEKIYNKVKKEVKDATFNEQEKKIEKEQIGIDFGISIEDAKKIVEEDKEEYIIPLKLTKPKVTTEAFLAKAFPDVLATYTSYAAGCGPARATNLFVGARSINGSIVNPGEIFSFNNTVGSVTAAKGYMPGGTYSNGGISSEIGGGICQVVSTLYNSALISGMDIVERHQHIYLVDYVPAGRDATMYIPSLDLKFKNIYSRPIKIVASANGGTVNVQILGVNEGIRGEISSAVNSTVPRPVERIPDANLLEGEERRSASGMDGARSTTYYKLWKNGQVIKNGVIHSDYYRPVGKVVIRYGTKKIQPQPQPEPQPQPQPKPEPEPKPETPKE